jgi:hypothetical protein
MYAVIRMYSGAGGKKLIDLLEEEPMKASGWRGSGSRRTRQTRAQARRQYLRARSFSSSNGSEAVRELEAVTGSSPAAYFGTVAQGAHRGTSVGT